MDDILLIPNQVIQDCNTQLDYRVLWASQDKSLAYWICLSRTGNTPTCFDYLDVAEGIQEERYILLPDLFMKHPADNLDQSWASRRDRAWGLIKDAVKLEPEIYGRASRAEILKEIEERTGVKRNNLYDYLGKYWKGGMIPNALLPDYDNCGKVSPLSNPSANRRGRKKVTGAEGKTLTVQDTQNFQTILKKYYYTKDKLTLEKTYEKLLKEHYAIRNENGEFVSLVSPDEIPSRAQFLYWHRKNKDVLKESKARDGERNYNLKNRASIGKTETFLSGPCAVAQIDATIADIFLVRQDDRNAIVGRPTLYFLLDGYSRMVMGMHVTLEAPSERAASMCILNALEDKVNYCAKYGITITPEEWPCRHSPSTIVADRGEMEGKSFDNIVKNLGITIENMPPYRGDLKGIVEQYFHLIDISISGIPGKMGSDYGERCTHDYRLDAKLDIKEFTRIIIHCVLLHNQFHYMEFYSKTPHMRQLRVKPIPREIWEYGLRYCNGAQKIVDVARYRYVILPKDVASITDNGIQFKGLFYGCEQGFREKWFDCARVNGRTSVSTAYDPEDSSHIYIMPDASLPPIECFLLDENKMPDQLTVTEIEQINKLNHEEREQYRITEDTEKSRTQEKIDAIVKEAERKQNKSEKSKAQRIKEIGENRKAEMESMLENIAPDIKAVKNNERLDDETPDPVQKILEEELEKILTGGNNG